MSSLASSISAVPFAPVLTRLQREALRLLDEATEAARREGLDVWQFAVEISQLRDLGLSHTELRCLLCWNLLEHAQERTSACTSRRLFVPLGTLVLPRRTCFVLTAKGREAASEHGVKLIGNSSASAAKREEVPRWDNTARQLWWRIYLIKEFHRRADNQELILNALQEEGWPPFLDDPLPPVENIDPKTRLHDTIKALNGHHLYRKVHFRGDGRGQGIRWTFTKEDLK